MNDASMRSVGPSDEAEARLATLNGQVSAMRAVLVQLLQEVVVAEARLDHGEASLLLKANEQLIVSALAAQTDADSAHGALNAFADAAMHFAKKQRSAPPRLISNRSTSSQRRDRRIFVTPTRASFWRHWAPRTFLPRRRKCGAARPGFSR